MIHPDTELRYVNGEVGLGVFATKLIPKGTVTWVLDELDMILTPEKVASLRPAIRPLVERYSYQDEEKKHILCWDLAKYINHSCEPSCMGTYFTFEVAVRDIRPGEEFTNDYATYGDVRKERFPCACGAPECRGRVRPGDARRMARRWDEQIAGALALYDAVPQPLKRLLSKAEVKEVKARFGVAPNGKPPVAAA